ncbi:MAG TPA: TonB-dependent receptor [Rhizomicrobium sp.]|nr:TonB-dependent receptor [Rhizomicrobium sp.]
MESSVKSQRLARSRAFLLAGASAVTAVMLAAPAWAQASDQVETVTVTAEKRAENVQSVPMSITALSGHQLEDANITQFSDLANLVPNLAIITANNNRNTTLQIRNQGTSGTNPGIEPDVGLFVDGVYIPAAAPILGDLLDISTVEVLRGPQGTLYGRNTPVGDINITTRAPTAQTEGMIEGELGNFDERRVAGYFGGAIADNLAGRITLWSDTHSGYVRNLFNNRMVNDGDQYGARGRVRWTPDSATTVDFIAYYGNISTHGTYTGQVNPFGKGGIIGTGGTTPSYPLGGTFLAAVPNYHAPHGFETDDSATGAFDQTETYGASVTASRVLPFGATLTNILGYNWMNDDVKELAATSLPVQVLNHDWQTDKIGSTSDELRLVSPGNQFIDYVAGIYLFHDDLRYDTVGTFGPGANAQFTYHAGPLTTPAVLPGDHADFHYGQGTSSVAGYGQATVNVTDKLHVIGGLRYSIDHKDAGLYAFNGGPTPPIVGFALLNALVNPPVAFRHLVREDHALTWSGTVKYDVTENVMAYATMSNGFKDGGFNARSSTYALFPVAFAPEHSLNYEAGVKTTLFDNKVLLNADVYRMLITGFQSSSLQPGSGSLYQVFNAGTIHENGVEVDAQARPIEHLSLDGSVSYADTTYSNFPHGTCFAGYPNLLVNPISTTYCNLTGRTPPNSPRWRWNLGARWEQQWMDSHFEWFVSGNAHFTGSQVMDPSLDPRSFQDSYTLFDASLGIEPDSGNWRVQLFGRNLANKVYYTYEAPQPVGGLVDVVTNPTPGKGSVGANGFVGNYGQPRTFGIEASYKF